MVISDDFHGFYYCLSDADKSCFGRVPGQVKLSELRRFKFADILVYVEDFGVVGRLGMLILIDCHWF